MTPGTRAVLRVIASAFFIFFLGFLGISAPMYWSQYKILRTWPAADAEVTSCRVLVLESPSGPLHDIEVRFAFSVIGRPYAGVIHSNHLSTSRDRKEKQAAGFPVGSHHQIRYNPADPSDVRARVGYNLHFFAVPIFVSGVGAIFLVIGLVIWVASSRH
ncbi:MAG TPA: DUF3592 domain-containing protein [Terriglobales bacterium]|nr:DUF3592 domain-containing protein [Terriglobales bacterium]